MTQEEIDKLSLQDCRKRLKQIYTDEYKIEMYLALTDKIKLITASLENIKDVDLKNKEDKQLIDLISDWSKKGGEMAKSLDEIREGLDKEVLAKEKRKRQQAKAVSVERMVLYGDD